MKTQLKSTATTNWPSTSAAVPKHAPATYLLPNLYLGDKYNASDLEELRRLGVTHIINCAKDLPDAFAEPPASPRPSSSNDDNDNNNNHHKQDEGEEDDDEDDDDGPIEVNGASEFTYYRCELNDSVHEDITAHFKPLFCFMDQVLSSKSPASPRNCTSSSTSSTSSPNALRPNVILVHCSAGVSRSPTICVAYLQHRLRWSLKKAFKFVRKARPMVAPNNGFLRALINYEHSLFGGNTMRIRRANKHDLDLVPVRKNTAREI